MRTNQLMKSGFVGQYLIAGPKEEPFINDDKDENQLRYETHLRSILPEEQTGKPQGEILLGENSRHGIPWSYYYCYGNWFVDVSTFYSTLTRVDLDACTQLIAPGDMEVKAVIWSYAAIDVWCNEVHVGSIKTPVYKPIQKQEITLSLKKGVNPVYISLQTLGVRDTRTLFGIQIVESCEEIQVSLPDAAHTDVLLEYSSWLSSAWIEDHKLKAGTPAPEGTMVGYDSMTPDFGKVKTKISWQDASGKSELLLEPGEAYVVLSCQANGQTLKRRMEDIRNIVPKQLHGLDMKSNQVEILKRTAAVESLSRGDKFGFSISNILARKALSMETDRDLELFLETLDQIESRYDCSDFLVCGLIRYLKNYELTPELSQRVKEVLLHYRYWMDQDGSDAMCFWSENHSLMFYVSAMNAGELYPREYFVRAGMTGAELYENGKQKMEQWLTDVEAHGFEEFLSTVYMCVTFAGLLNAIDYTPDSISERATKVTDRLLEMLAQHTYKGSIIAPMGRVYRQVIYPFLQGAQALMNLVNPDIPYSYGEGWLAFYATSSYKLPADLEKKMKEDADLCYSTGNALIKLEKNPFYCLTSVQSPRMDEGFKRWNNLTLSTGEVDKTTHEYTKSLNERFHGTTCFEPGTYGYQQHMWSAALDAETHIFVNHPGGTCDSSQMRPGYWYGNGVMPAVRQENGILCANYQIPENYPIHFTHVFWPEVKFDETRHSEHWLYGKKGDGFVAIWCSERLQPHNDQVMDCEYRSYGNDISYLCICTGTDSCKNLDDFIKYCQEKKKKRNL